MPLSHTSTFAALALAGLASGCTHPTPLDLAGVRLVLLCLVNCPASVTFSDEGSATDATPLENTSLHPENVFAVQRGKGQGPE